MTPSDIFYFILYSTLPTSVVIIHSQYSQYAFVRLCLEPLRHVLENGYPFRVRMKSACQREKEAVMVNHFPMATKISCTCITWKSWPQSGQSWAQVGSVPQLCWIERQEPSPLSLKRQATALQFFVTGAGAKPEKRKDRHIQWQSLFWGLISSKQWARPKLHAVHT